MEKHEFFRQYANTPLAKRSIPLSLIHDTTTLDRIYSEVKHYDDMISNAKKNQEEMLEKADQIFKLVNEKK